MPESTPVQVPFSYARWNWRVSASGLDGLMLVAVLIVTGLPGYVTAEVSGGEPGALTYAGIVVWFAVVAWFAWIGGVTGQTPGKAMMGLRIVLESTGRPGGGLFGLGRDIVHHGTNFFCGIFGLVDVLWPLRDAKRRTLHDKMMGCVVVSDVPARPFSFDLFRPSRAPYADLLAPLPELAPGPAASPLVAPVTAVVVDAGFEVAAPGDQAPAGMEAANDRTAAGGNAARSGAVPPPAAPDAAVDPTLDSALAPPGASAAGSSSSAVEGAGSVPRTRGVSAFDDTPPGCVAAVADAPGSCDGSRVERGPASSTGPSLTPAGDDLAGTAGVRTTLDGAGEGSADGSRGRVESEVAGGDGEVGEDGEVGDDGNGGDGNDSEPRGEGAWQRPRRRVLTGAAVAVVLLALAGTGGYWFGGHRDAAAGGAAGGGQGASEVQPGAGSLPGGETTEQAADPSTFPTGDDSTGPDAGATVDPSTGALDPSGGSSAGGGSTAAPGELPIGVVFDKDQEGFGTARPSVLDGGEPSERVTDISWDTYGGKVATGHGKALWTGNGPGETPQTGPVEDVDIRAYDRDDCLGSRAYLQVWWYFPGRGETVHNLRHGFPNVCNLATAYTYSSQVSADDGKHYGFISSVSSDSVTVDIIGWTTGAKMRGQCAADSIVDPPEQWCSAYYYRNANSRQRTFPLAPGATVSRLDERSQPMKVTPGKLEAWLGEPGNRDQAVFRFDTQSNAVTKLTQVYAAS